MTNMLSAIYIEGVLNVVMEVAKGNYDVEVPLTGDNDEFDALAMGINMMIDEIKSRKELEAANKEMKKAKEQAELAKKIKEQFLANMSHEIRTPMNAIVGMTDILLDQQLNPDQKKCIEAIKISADNLLTIINEVLDFSKIEAGKITFEKTPFHLEETLENIIQTLQFTANSKNLSLTYSISNNTPVLLVGDVTKLRQILINLASNSIKFTESGRIKIEIFSQALNQDDYLLEFSISDTGIGIPENKIDTIFESFTQATNDTTRKYGGTGLGLTIVKSLVELQGGKIALQSKLNEGTTFTFHLPFKKGDAIHEINEEQKTDFQNKLKNINVLLVEDNAINRFLAQTVLNKWDCNIHFAENGRIAVEKVSNEIFDIILMDIQMPELDGYDAAREIRKMQTPMTSVPIIAMTAHAMEGEIDKCKSAGMNDYISKPFNKKMLYEKMCNMLKVNNIKNGGGG